MTLKDELVTLNDEVEALLEAASEGNEVSRQTLGQLESLHDNILDAMDDNRTVRRMEVDEFRRMFTELRDSIERGSDKIADALGDLGTNIIGGAAVLGIFGLFSAAIGELAKNPDFVLFQKTVRLLNLLEEFEPISIVEMEKKLLYRGWSEHDAKHLLPGLIDRGLAKKGTRDGVDCIETDYESDDYKDLMGRLDTIRNAIENHKNT